MKEKDNIYEAAIGSMPRYWNNQLVSGINSYNQKEVSCISPENLANIQDITEKNLRLILKLIETKSSDYCVNLNLVDTAIINIPYSNVECIYAYKCSYYAVDTEQESYTVNVKKSRQIPYQHSETVRSSENNYVPRTETVTKWRTEYYTEPETRYKTIEVNPRTIEYSGGGKIQLNEIATDLDELVFNIDLKDHKSREFIEMLKGEGNNIFDTPDSFFIDVKPQEFVDKVKLAVTGSIHSDLKIGFAPFDKQNVINLSKKTNDLSGRMLNEAKNESAVGDRNRDYEIEDSEISYKDKNILLESFLIQVYRTKDHYFSLSTNLRTSRTQYLIKPKQLTKSYRILRWEYLSPLAASVATSISCYVLTLISNLYLQKRVTIVNYVVRDELFGLYIGIAVAIFFWILCVFKERNHSIQSVKMLLQKKINLLRTFSSYELLQGDTKLHVTNAVNDNTIFEFKKFKIYSKSFTPRNVLIVATIAYPVIFTLARLFSNFLYNEFGFAFLF